MNVPLTFASSLDPLNAQVIKLMQSFTSKELVKEIFS